MGLETRHVGELGMAQASDQEILTFAAREELTVVTLDSDFVKIVAIEGRSTPSVIHLRFPNLDRLATVKLLEEILPLLSEDLKKGCIASVGPLGIRIRTLPLLRG